MNVTCRVGNGPSRPAELCTWVEPDDHEPATRTRWSVDTKVTWDELTEHADTRGAVPIEIRCPDRTVVGHAQPACSHISSYNPAARFPVGVQLEVLGDLPAG